MKKGRGTSWRPVSVLDYVYNTSVQCKGQNWKGKGNWAEAAGHWKKCGLKFSEVSKLLLFTLSLSIYLFIFKSGQMWGWKSTWIE